MHFSTIFAAALALPALTLAAPTAIPMDSEMTTANTNVLVTRAAAKECKDFNNVSAGIITVVNKQNVPYSLWRSTDGPLVRFEKATIPASKTTKLDLSKLFVGDHNKYSIAFCEGEGEGATQKNCKYAPKRFFFPEPNMPRWEINYELLTGVNVQTCTIGQQL